MAELYVLTITVFMLFWFVCACRATIRQSAKEQVTTFSDINREMLAVLHSQVKKLIR